MTWPEPVNVFSPKVAQRVTHQYAKFQRDPPSGSAVIWEKLTGVATPPPSLERVKASNVWCPNSPYCGVSWASTSGKLEEPVQFKLKTCLYFWLLLQTFGRPSGLLQDRHHSRGKAGVKRGLVCSSGSLFFLPLSWMISTHQPFLQRTTYTEVFRKFL